jgi:hypothetical protein
MSQCPEFEERAAMSDEEFWDHVLQPDRRDAPTQDEDFLDDSDPGAPFMATPCRVCGESAACGYDSEGRPMIHVLDFEEPDD